jgi:hypothetical protein
MTNTLYVEVDRRPLYSRSDYAGPVLELFTQTKADLKALKTGS